MKKLISLLMIAAMILSLAACSGGTESIGFFHVVRHGKHCFRRGERSV